MKQGDRFGGVTERLQILKDFLIRHTGLFAKSSTRGVGVGVLTHLLNQLLFPFSEVLLFEGTTTFGKQIFICHVSPPSIFESGFSNYTRGKSPGLLNSCS
jgi:hypothetical protein